MKIEMELKNLENIGYVTKERLDKFREIFEALIVSGGLSGVRSGQTIIHFDHEGVFQGIELSYWPWRKRRLQ